MPPNLLLSGPLRNFCTENNLFSRFRKLLLAKLAAQVGCVATNLDRMLIGSVHSKVANVRWIATKPHLPIGDRDRSRFLDSVRLS